MTTDRVVEVFSAANVFEANRLCALLEEEGIRAKVVGDMLGNAAGWLPPRETAPRVWVRQQDESRARQIIDAWGHEAYSDASSVDESDGGEDEETPEARTDGLSTGDQSVTLAGKILATAGIGCILFGIATATQCWRVAGELSGTAAAILTDRGYYPRFEYDFEPGRSDLPVRLQPVMGVRLVRTSEYTYVVQGESYVVCREGLHEPPHDLTIRYNPRHPAEYRVGPLTPPWLPLVLGSSFGLFLILVGYKFR
jgi:hypothetical protein